MLTRFSFPCLSAACAGEGPQEAYSRHYEEWMVIDPGMVTTTGLECDKIGVSYS